MSSDIVRTLRAAGCVFAEDEAALLVSAARTPAELADLVERRVTGLPLEHVLGWAEFCGLRIAVSPGVFVPRPRSEFLVRRAVALARPGAVVVDLCCGSGALGVAVCSALGGAGGSPAGAAASGGGVVSVGGSLYAVDVDPAAVDCARRNVAAVGGSAYRGDLYEPLPGELRGLVDLLVANVPYVPTGAIALMPAEARVHEPRVALDGGPDGLDVLRRVAAGAPEWLAPGGSLLIETSEHQAPAAVAAFATTGLATRVATDDELGATVVIGTAPADGF